MLPKLARQKSGRGWWGLFLCSLAILAFPTWTQQAKSQGDAETKADKRAAEKTGDKTSEKPAVKAAEKPVGNDLRIGAGLSPANPQANIPSLGIRRTALPPMAPPSVEFLPEPAKAEKRILEILSEEVDLNFTDESLQGVVSYLAENHGLQIVIDKVKLEEESVATDAADITRTLSGISLRSGLNILLKPKNLAIVIEDEVLKITTATDASEKLLNRTYPVRDLVGNSDVDYKLLLTTIQMATGDPANGVAWLDMDGEGGTISILPAPGCLVIRATRETHEEVLELLRSVRKANTEVAEVNVK